MDARLVYSAERTSNQVLRVLDLDERTLVVRIPWDQQPLDTWRQVAPQLTDEERRVLAAALTVNPLWFTDEGPA
jgi:predicted DNA binding protein